MLAGWFAEKSRIGDFLVCRECGRGSQAGEVEIIALDEALPDVMARDWTAELSCGHTGTDYRVPVDFDEDPAVCRSRNPDRRFACRRTDRLTYAWGDPRRFAGSAGVTRGSLSSVSPRGKSAGEAISWR